MKKMSIAPTTLCLSLSLLLVANFAMAKDEKMDPGPFEESDAVIQVFQSARTRTHKEFKSELGMSLKSENDEFVYYQTGNATFRLFKNPKPRLGYKYQQSIPAAPGHFWPGNFEFVSDGSHPAKPNCSEAPFNYSDYRKIVDSRDVRTKADFLNKLPSDVLQKFTFITKSDSLQRHGVTEKRPRVMRFRTDGKFMLTYTTEKMQNQPDTIEAIFFDDATRKFNFIHTEFLTEDDINPQHRTKTILNPKSCMGCHGGQDPRPNWAQYDKWKGTFGQNDDFLGALGDTVEPVQYATMRKELANTPELSTLPWPHRSSDDFELYPYINVNKLMNYNSRPNAHFTIVQSRLNAQRLARKFSEAPQAHKYQWSLLAHSLGCDDFKSGAESPNPILQSLIKTNAKEIQKYESDFQIYYGTKKSSRILYELGIALGFYTSDWSLRFNLKPLPGFEKFTTAQWELKDLIESVLFNEAVKKDPRLDYYEVRYNLMSNLFGEHFTCVDDVADRLWLTKKNKAPICKILTEQANNEIKAIQKSDIDQAVRSKMVLWTPPFQRDPSDDSLQNGERIITQTCGQCHTGEAIPFNFKDKEALQALMRQAGPGYKVVIQSAIQECRMPMAVSGPCLSANEQAAVLKYLDELIEK